MAYNTIKKCAKCTKEFKANSNPQKYCGMCKFFTRKERNKKWQYTYYMKNKTEKLEKSRAYNKSEKGRASQMVRDAIRQGKMIRGNCEVCGSEKAQGHHENYDEPLQVRWLCPQHHREEHLFEPWQNDLRRAGYKGGFLLGQLIEACGEKFSSLQKKIGGYSAFGLNEGTMEYGYSVTPREAVAKLYLELNKK